MADSKDKYTGNLSNAGGTNRKSEGRMSGPRGSTQMPLYSHAAAKLRSVGIWKERRYRDAIAKPVIIFDAFQTHRDGFCRSMPDWGAYANTQMQTAECSSQT